MSLSRRRPAAGSVNGVTARGRRGGRGGHGRTPRTAPAAYGGECRCERPSGHMSGRRGPSAAPEAVVAADGADPEVADSVDTTAVQRWQPIAESLVREGVTSKHPELVATILAEREAGTPPSTIGRTYKVHHTTVGRILTAAQELTA